MKRFYFTFGQDHKQIDGTPMRNHWVTVEGEDYEHARRLFVEKFAVPFMGDAAKWSFQYQEGSENWKPGYFPEGQYTLIKQTEDEN